jgi:oligosaccharide repeat unit polymerase
VKNYGYGKTQKSILTPNHLAIRISCIICVSLMIYPTISAIQKIIILGFNIAQIRTESEIVYSNILLKLLYNYFAIPFSYAIIPLFSTLILIDKKKDKILIISTIFIILTRIITEGGRLIVLYLILNLVIARVIVDRGKIKNMLSRKEIGITSLIVFGIIIIYQVTLSRTNSPLLYHVYTYISGCMPHLSSRLEYVDASGSYTLGVASLYGFFFFVFTMLENIGFPFPQFMIETTKLIDVYDQVVINSSGDTYNAFVSLFYHMYLDGRVLGVIIGMLVYGIVSYHFYKKIKHRINYRDLAIYLLIAQGLYISFVRVPFVVMHYDLSFAFFYILINKKRHIGISNI